VWVNLDPSHFWWQGADPVLVVRELSGAIGWAHGKDTTIYPERVALRGMLDPTFPPDPASSSWHFSAVGAGHDLPTWRGLVRALQDAGHDGVISIEHEDPALSPQECIARSATVLRDAVAV
jgi:sugar phosphate isomerase/epimerase